MTSPLQTQAQSTVENSDHYKMCADCIARLTRSYDLSQAPYTLEQLANRYELSPTHFQKIFKSLVGVSPKQFQQALLVKRSKPHLSKQSVEQTTLEFGLSSASRLHDAYVSIDALSPGEFKSLGDNLVFSWAIEPSIFGPLLVVSTDRGLNYLGFYHGEDTLYQKLNQLRIEFPKALINQAENNQILKSDPFTHKQAVKICVNATNFQIQVWQALLNTAPGELLSYKHIAEKLGRPTAARAVGRAIGSNPIAFLIPCHRVIQQSGALSGYRWGVEHKQQLIAWEEALKLGCPPITLPV